MLLGHTYSAILGKGAWLNGVPLNISQKTEIGIAMVGTGQAAPGDNEQLHFLSVDPPQIPWSELDGTQAEYNFSILVFRFSSFCIFKQTSISSPIVETTEIFDFCALDLNWQHAEWQHPCHRWPQICTLPCRHQNQSRQLPRFCLLVVA